MCSNYRAVTNLDLIASFFGVVRDPGATPPEFSPEVWPLGLAPIIRLDENGRRALDAGTFGLIPHWSKKLEYGRRTYNSRSETVDQLPSFKTAWQRSQRCIVPAEAVYEPCYETGKAVRWGIEREDGHPLGIAGIWVDHPELRRANGESLLSFAMLTVSGAGHPVFQRMHGENDEKRMVVILDENDYDAWLTCSPDEAREFFKQWAGPLKSYPKPLAPRKKKEPVTPKSDPTSNDIVGLFPPLKD